MAQAPQLRIRTYGGGKVQRTEDGWLLTLPAGCRRYCLAQLDDYGHLPRRRYPWRPPVVLSLEARMTGAAAAGTWGFGFWNDPFPGLGGAANRLPAFPQALWFFGAAPPNHLSLHPEVPARGFFAGVTFWPGRAWDGLLAPWVALLVPWPGLRETARRWVARRMRQWGRALNVDPAQWHRYRILWARDRVRFWVDDALIGETPLVPPGPLGLVLWVDNQFAAWPPGGLPRWGVRPTSEPAALALRDVRCHPPDAAP